MTDETTGSPGGEAIADTGGDLTLAQAVQLQTQERMGEKPKEKQPAESAEPATAEQKLAPEADAGPEEVPGETQEADPEAEKLPPIERPRSWSKDADDDWNALPRARQEKIAENDRAREADINRRINEAAEKTKAVDAKVKEAEQAKQHYEAQAQAAMQVLLDQNNGKFGMIKSHADLNYLRGEASRLAQAGEVIQSQQITAFLGEWEAHQQEMATRKAELDRLDNEKSQKQFSEWNSHVAAENTRVKEKIPDLADPVKNKAFYERAVERMKELDFSDAEISDLATGKKMLSVHDHRLQRLIWNDLQLSNIQKAKVAVAEKPVPPVQRPGTSKPAGSTESATIQALEAKFNRTGSLKDAQALHAAQFARRA